MAYWINTQQSLKDIKKSIINLYGQNEMVLNEKVLVSIISKTKNISAILEVI